MDILDKLQSQIGDDVQHIFDHEALFKAATAEITRLRAAIDAARAHNADLSAALEARVKAARAKALEDAEKVADDHTPSRPLASRATATSIAAAIRAMREQEERGMSDMPEQIFRSARVVKDASLLYDPMPQKDVSLPSTRADAPLTTAEAIARCPEVAALVQAAQAKAVELENMERLKNLNWLDAVEAKADRDAALRQLSAAEDAMDTAVSAARAKALEDAASLASEKADDWWSAPYGKDYTATDMMGLAAAIRAMKDPKS